MPQIDTTCPRLNPARWPAISHAHYRARRERKPMVVYVAPPGTRQTMDAFVNNVHNVWFVRPIGEAAPPSSTVVETVQPPAPVAQRESGPFLSDRDREKVHEGWVSDRDREKIHE